MSENCGGVDGGVSAQDVVVVVGFVPEDSNYLDEEGAEVKSEYRMYYSPILTEVRPHMIDAEPGVEPESVLVTLMCRPDVMGKVFYLLGLGQVEIEAGCSALGPGVLRTGLRM